jgi:hypothetical protein
VDAKCFVPRKISLTGRWGVPFSYRF